jgi:hypothetical protein
MEAALAVTPPAVTESKMQAVLMRWAMEEKKHQLAIPNATIVYSWEADLLSVTSSWLTHEFEIKLSKSDHRADFKKVKHYRFSQQWQYGKGKRLEHTPNYFWFATYGYEVDVTTLLPPYAGWLTVEWHERSGVFMVKVQRAAPRLHTEKMRENTRLKLGRWLSFKLKNMYRIAYLQRD